MRLLFIRKIVHVVSIYLFTSTFCLKSSGEKLWEQNNAEYVFNRFGCFLAPPILSLQQ